MTKPTKIEKPKKPRKNFPLFPDGNGQWAAKIDGKKRYFGKWNAPLKAEERYLRSAGRN